MSYKINVKTNATKFKSAPRNPLDIPTGPLDKPLTTGYEVFEWLKANAFLTTRYKFRGRARGVEWYDSKPLNEAERIALYIDEKPDYDSKMKAEHDRLSALQCVKDNIEDLSSLIRSYETIHGDEVVISFKKS
mgnify:FL=1